MTIDQFFSEFAQAVETHRPRVLLDTRHHIRVEMEGRAYCPITFVCAFKDPAVFFNAGQFDLAAEAIGLPYNEAAAVADAADNNGPVYRSIAREKVDTYRRRILAALGIEDDSPAASYRARVDAHHASMIGKTDQ